MHFTTDNDAKRLPCDRKDGTDPQGPSRRRRSNMIGGWTLEQPRSSSMSETVPCASETTQTSSIADGSTTIVGHIVAVRINGEFDLHMDVQKHDGSTVRVRCQGTHQPSAMQAWLTIRGARALLVPGVHVCVDGKAPANDQHVWATRATVLAALPATPYLAKLLSLSFEELHSLFDETETPSTLSIPVGLAVALRPWNIHQCEVIVRCCQSANYISLFKNKELMRLANDMRQFQGWSRKARRVPPTSPTTWSALLRMEQNWCRDCDGTVEEVSDVTDYIHGCFVDGNVDPSLNLPDATDARRVKYVNERKRPQVLWMLELIKRLVDGLENQHGLIHLADIGGGRGDLANAVAAYFTAGKNCSRRVHVTVIDLNKSSLDAGRARAVDAGLGSYMTFVLCDLEDTERVTAVLEKSTFDMVFGLHCCGGLAEAAVELALQCRATFCISTCCFQSNDQMATLSQLSDSMIVLEQHKNDRASVSALAVIAGSQGQHRAIRALNAMRLVAAERRFQTIIEQKSSLASLSLIDKKRNFTARLCTWQESFPIKFSVQNRIMIGSVVAR